MAGSFTVICKSTWEAQTLTWYWNPSDGTRGKLVPERRRAPAKHNFAVCLCWLPGSQTQSNFTELTFHTKPSSSPSCRTTPLTIPSLTHSVLSLLELFKNLHHGPHHSSVEPQREVTSIKVLASALSRYQDTMATSEDTRDTIEGSEDTQFIMVEPEDKLDGGEEMRRTRSCVRLQHHVSLFSSLILL